MFFFQAEDGIRYLVRSRGLGDVYKRQVVTGVANDNASGAIYAAGYTKSSGAITGTAGTVSGGQDAFLIKYTTSGSLAWSFTPSGNGTSQATGIAVDANGNSYVTGWYKNSIDLHGLSATGSGVLIGNGDLNWFIASYASDGTPVSYTHLTLPTSDLV